MSANSGRNKGLRVKVRKVDELRPYPGNARTHDEDQVDAVARSIEEFGFANPVLIDGDGVILAGHGRILAARKIGMDRVPTIELSHLSEDQRRAFVLADNALAERAGWDLDLLKGELEALSEAGFSLDLTGIDEAELDEILFAEEATTEATEGGSEVFVQSIQLEPAREYILVTCEDQAEWDALRGRLEMGTVRRGGYKRGSAFDSTGPQRVIAAADLLERLA